MATPNRANFEHTGEQPFTLRFDGANRKHSIAKDFEREMGETRKLFLDYNLSFSLPTPHTRTAMILQEHTQQIIF